MGGGLMQLVAYGAQDIYLTGNPQITFFKVVYRRHTNFSVESIEQTFNGTPNFGKKVSATIARNGDLIHRVLLEVQLPELTAATAGGSPHGWFDHLGERLLKYIDIEIGGQRIDRHYGEWLHLWNQLTLPESQKAGYLRMIGHTPNNINPNTSDCAAQKLYIPLQFWFCRNPGLALPLIALQYHEVKINIEFEELSNLAFSSVGTSGNKPSFGTPNESISSASLWVDYIYLDTDERRRFAQLSHEYLIEQLQFPGEETITVTSNKIKLAFNHPVKELVWVVQNTDIKDSYKQLFNYTSRVDLTPILSAYSTGDIIQEGMVQSLIATGNTDNDLLTYRSSGGGSYSVKDSGLNNVEKAKLQLNGQDRFAERDGSYFNLVVPHYHHTSIPKTGINVYSFGLKPEEHQPSGTCNFSRIDNANLFLTVLEDSLKGTDINATVGVTEAPPTKVNSYPYYRIDDAPSGSGSAKVRVYAVNYNVLRIMSGMGGLAYSN